LYGLLFSGTMGFDWLDFVQINTAGLLLRVTHDLHILQQKDHIASIRCKTYLYVIFIIEPTPK
jgi:hypothetical protein